MSRTITKPKLVAHRPPVFDEAATEQKPVEEVKSKSRSDVEVWNSSFPKRAWLDAETGDVETSPQVRPAGHERGGKAPQQRQDVLTEILDNLKSTATRPGELPGLCRNCARLDDCTYPKPESGVWHCDEYE